MSQINNGHVPLRVNGIVAATGTPGSYVCLDRTWADSDVVTLELPMKFRVTKYTGLDQDKRRDRYALEYGPILMALVGAAGLNIAPDAMVAGLSRISDSALHFGVAGYPNCKYAPYWEVQGEEFTCFPTLL